jgi:phosphohistidine phosphatase
VDGTSRTDLKPLATTGWLLHKLAGPARFRWGFMLQLILLRHAKAESPEATDDFDRALAPRGREDAPQVAAALAAEGAAPDIALVSDARRTRETWELAAPFFPKTRVKYLHSLYHCSAEMLMAAAELADTDRVMLIGHNPGMHELASRLAHRNNPLETKLRSKFPTAAGAMFTRKDKESAWKLQAYVTPKMISD